MKELFARTAALVVYLVYAVACTASAETRSGSVASKPEYLIKQVLTALEMRDQAALEKLTIHSS